MTPRAGGATLGSPTREHRAIETPRQPDPTQRPIVSATLRSLALIAIAMLLIVVLLPAALVAAGT